ncbi:MULTISPECIES: glycoside hydrolase family 73 protein [Bacillus]|uniref:glycoside hydrolase family 73 protein n=1 Tax=Bacillus TaxID=1386 RepID=UPI0002EE25A7|nr:MULTISPECIES: glucosaminidase domain-containing protein [Bacillus]
MKKYKIIWPITIILVLIVAWNIFENENKINISIETMKYISTTVDEKSKGKAQVNWKNVASVIAAEHDLMDVSTDSIEKTVNLFIEKQDDKYIVKSLDDVTNSLHFSNKQLKTVELYKTYFDKKGVFTSRMSEDSIHKKFIASIENAAKTNFEKTGILPSITIAQAILESDWGRSKLAVEYKNLFGIKGHNWNGETASLNTNEFYDKEIKAEFRVYDSITDSINDHGVFLMDNPRYKKHGLFESKTYLEQAMSLHNANYSTAENEKGEKIYSELLVQLIKQYQLQLIDSQVYEKYN